MGDTKEEEVKPEPQRQNQELTANPLPPPTITANNTPLSSSNQKTPESAPLSQFGWYEIEDGVVVPYITRDLKKYVADRLVSYAMTALANRVFSSDFLSCIVLERTHMTQGEADTLNEINIVHCDRKLTGSLKFKCGMVMIALTDVIKFFEYFHICRKGVTEKAKENSLFGFMKINCNGPVPFVWDNSTQLVPMFYFEGQSKYLDAKSVDLTEPWKVTYLKFCCKLQKIKKDFYETHPLKVVNFEYVKKLFPGDTKFELSWPERMNEDLLVSSIRVLHSNIGKSTSQNSNDKNDTHSSTQKKERVQSGQKRKNSGSDSESKKRAGNKRDSSNITNQTSNTPTLVNHSPVQLPNDLSTKRVVSPTAALANPLDQVTNATAASLYLQRNNVVVPQGTSITPVSCGAKSLIQNIPRRPAANGLKQGYNTTAQTTSKYFQREVPLNQMEFPNCCNTQSASSQDRIPNQGYNSSLLSYSVTDPYSRSQPQVPSSGNRTTAISEKHDYTVSNVPAKSPITASSPGLVQQNYYMNGASTGPSTSVSQAPVSGYTTVYQDFLKEMPMYKKGTTGKSKRKTTTTATSAHLQEKESQQMIQNAQLTQNYATYYQGLRIKEYYNYYGFNLGTVPVSQEMNLTNVTPFNTSIQRYDYGVQNHTNRSTPQSTTVMDRNNSYIPSYRMSQKMKNMEHDHSTFYHVAEHKIGNKICLGISKSNISSEYLINFAEFINAVLGRDPFLLHDDLESKFKSFCNLNPVQQVYWNNLRPKDGAIYGLYEDIFVDYNEVKEKLSQCLF